MRGSTPLGTGRKIDLGSRFECSLHCREITVCNLVVNLLLTVHKTDLANIVVMNQ